MFPNWSLGTRKRETLSMWSGFFPLCRAEHRGFRQELPAGVRQGCRTFFAGAGKPHRKTPDESHGAQDQRGIGAAFSLVTFFWRSKRKLLGCRAETRLQNQAVAIATHNLKLTIHSKPSTTWAQKTMPTLQSTPNHGAAIFSKIPLTNSGINSSLRYP